MEPKINPIRGGTMFQMNHDFFDSFPVQFYAKETIVGGEHYPLGHFAVEALEVSGRVFREIDRLQELFQEEFQIFLSARSPSSAARAHTAVLALWEVVGKLPLYEKISPSDKKIHFLMGYMKEHPEEVADMLTVGTERHAMLIAWQQKLQLLAKQLRDFQTNTYFMLTEYFEQLPARTPAEYTRAYAKYKDDIRNAYDVAEWEEGDTAELDSVKMDFPFSLSFQPRIHPKTGRPFLAEEIHFGTLESFLHTDLMRGMAAGNLPRRCHNCGHYFLAVGAYDTVYCTRIAPCETTKTCRKVGAHRKEKEKNANEFIYREYARASNRLKGRKQRGSITVDKWNQQMAIAQELRAKALAGEISDGDYVGGLDKLDTVPLKG